MKRYEVFYSDADGQHSVVVEAENFHTAKAQCPKKSKAGVPLADKIEEVGADAALTDWTAESPPWEDDDSAVPVEADPVGSGGETGGAEAGTEGGVASADAEAAAGGTPDEGSAGGGADSQGGGV